MSHECELCGQWCDCDGEDHGQPQPKKCVHLTGDEPWDRDEDDDDCDCDGCTVEPEDCARGDCDCLHCISGESPDVSEPDGSHG
jgi:hypothetical protein